MSITANTTVQMATMGLTGRREADIAYLQEQIRAYREDTQTVGVLKSILNGLMPSEMSMAAA